MSQRLEQKKYFIGSYELKNVIYSEINMIGIQLIAFNGRYFAYAPLIECWRVRQLNIIKVEYKKKKIMASPL